MKKYYIGLATLFALSIGLVIYVAMQAGDSKQDEQTSKKFDEIANKLDEVSYQSSEVPASLDELEVKDVPSTITYQKVDNETYKICVTYSTQSNYLDGGIYSILFGSFADIPMYEEDTSTEPKDYLDRTQAWYHKKGQTCQTVKPLGIYSQDPEAGYGNKACDSYTDAGFYGSATVESVDTANKAVTFSTNDQWLYNSRGQQVTQTIGTKSYDDDTLVCDYANPNAVIDDIDPGTDVGIELDSVDDPILNRVDVYSEAPNGL